MTGFALCLQMGDHVDHLWIKHGDQYTRLDGAKNYGGTGYDASDPLHRFLDELDPASVAVIMTYEWYHVNPSNARSAPTIAALERLIAAEPGSP